MQVQVIELPTTVSPLINFPTSTGVLLAQENSARHLPFSTDKVVDHCSTKRKYIYSLRQISSFQTSLSFPGRFLVNLLYCYCTAGSIGVTRIKEQCPSSFQLSARRREKIFVSVFDELSIYISE